MSAGFSDGSADQEYACNAGDTGDLGLILRSGKSLGGGKWQPISIYLPEKCHRLRSLIVYSPKGGKESDTTERLNMHACMMPIIYYCIQRLR